MAYIQFDSKDKTLARLEINDMATVSSLTEEEWKQIANQFDLSVIFIYDLEETTYKQDTYIIQKNKDPKSYIPIDEVMLLETSNSNLKFLGIQELHGLADNNYKPSTHYSFKTMHGLESFDYFDGKILATYKEGEIPEELDQITKKQYWKLLKLEPGEWDYNSD